MYDAIDRTIEKLVQGQNDDGTNASFASIADQPIHLAGASAGAGEFGIIGMLPIMANAADISQRPDWWERVKSLTFMSGGAIDGFQLPHHGGRHHVRNACAHLFEDFRGSHAGGRRVKTEHPQHDARVAAREVEQCA